MNAPTNKNPKKQDTNSQSAAKKERLAKALRQNLLRRKEAASDKRDGK